MDIFLGGHTFSELFFGVIYNSKYFFFGVGGGGGCTFLGKSLYFYKDTKF